MSEEEFITKSFRINKRLWENCEKLIKRGIYASDSELVRDAIRKLLEEKQNFLREG